MSSRLRGRPKRKQGDPDPAVAPKHDVYDLSDSSEDDPHQTSPQKKRHINRQQRKESHEETIYKKLIDRGLMEEDIAEMSMEQRKVTLKMMEASEKNYKQEAEIRALHEAQRNKVLQQKEKHGSPGPSSQHTSKTRKGTAAVAEGPEIVEETEKDTVKDSEVDVEEGSTNRRARSRSQTRNTKETARSKGRKPKEKSSEDVSEQKVVNPKRGRNASKKGKEDAKEVSGDSSDESKVMGQPAKKTRRKEKTSATTGDGDVSKGQASTTTRRQPGRKRGKTADEEKITQFFQKEDAVEQTAGENIERTASDGEEVEDVGRVSPTGDADDTELTTNPNQATGQDPVPVPTRRGRPKLAQRVQEEKPPGSCSNRKATKSKSPYFKGTVTEDDDESDASAIFEGRSQRDSCGTHQTETSQELKSIPEKMNTPQGCDLEADCGGSSPELFASQPNYRNLQNQEKESEPSQFLEEDMETMDPTVDLEETQPLEPLQLSVTGDSEILDDKAQDPTTNNSGNKTDSEENKEKGKYPQKRKINLESTETPPMKRRPIMFDFEMEIFGFSTPAQDLVTSPQKLVNKRRLHTKPCDRKPLMFAPLGTDHKKYVKSIINHFNEYRVLLRETQACLPTCLQWGKPVVVGRHWSKTIDMKVRGELSFEFDQGDNNDEDWEHVPMLATKPTQRKVGIRRLLTEQCQKQPFIPLSHSVKPTSRTPGQSGLLRRITPTLRKGETQHSTPKTSQMYENDDSSENEFVTIVKRQKRNRRGEPVQDAFINFIPETQEFGGDEGEAEVNGDMESPEGELPTAASRDHHQGKFDEKIQAQSTPLQSRPSAKRDISTSEKQGRNTRSRDSPQCGLFVDLDQPEDSGSNFEDLFADAKHQTDLKCVQTNNGEDSLDELVAPYPRTPRKKAPSRAKVLDPDTGSESQTKLKRRSWRNAKSVTESEDKEQNDQIQLFEEVTGDHLNNESLEKQRKGGRGRNKSCRSKTTETAEMLEPPGGADTHQDADPQPGPSAAGTTQASSTAKGGRRQPRIRPVNDSASDSETVTRSKKQKVEKEVTEGLLPCPICYQNFSSEEIQTHAALCQGTANNQNPGHSNVDMDENIRAEGRGQRMDRRERNARNLSDDAADDHHRRTQRPISRNIQVAENTDSTQNSTEDDSADEWKPQKKDKLDEQEDDADDAVEEVEIAISDDPQSDPTSDDGSGRKSPKSKKSRRKRKKKLLPGQKQIPFQAQNPRNAAAVQESGTSADIATETCPMCGNQVPLDQFARHVPECVDSAELKSAVLDIEKETTDDVLPVMTRPLRRRPLRSAPNRSSDNEFDENMPLDPRHRQL